VGSNPTLAASTTVGAAVGNLRVRRFRTVCTGCNLCRPPATYVNVGFQQVAGDDSNLIF
jgi:hypothetical protein